MKKMSKVVTIRIITVLFLVSLPLLGSDCEDIINQINQDPCTTGDVTGNWTLIYNSGTLLDVCPGETVSFPNNSSGTATLTCPNQNPIQRTYSISNQTITYNETSIQYQVCFDSDHNLVLKGIGNDRVLYYKSSVTDKKNDTQINTDNKAENYNSSEIKK